MSGMKPHSLRKRGLEIRRRKEQGVGPPRPPRKPVSDMVLKPPVRKKGESEKAFALRFKVFQDYVKRGAKVRKS